jgi:AcrR family transcriptional regulator
MYIGNNPTAIRSQRWFADALLELMKDNDFGKITVKDICSKSDLSRQTFYQLFSAKEDIIRYFLRACFCQIQEEIAGLPENDFKQLTGCYMHFFDIHEELVELLLRNNLEYLLEDELFQIIGVLVERINAAYPEHIRTYANAFISGAISNTLLCWFKNDEKISDGDLSELIYSILQGELFPAT